jgi:hypothetical protein
MNFEFEDIFTSSDYGEVRERKYRQWIRKANEAQHNVASTLLLKLVRAHRSRFKNGKLNFLFRSEKWENYIENVAQKQNKSEFEDVAPPVRIKCTLELLVASVELLETGEEKAALQALVNEFEIDQYNNQVFIFFINNYS